MEKMMNQYIRSIELKQVYDDTHYPFSLEIVRHLKKIDLHPNVTFIVGENGTGKSTLLEAIAIAYGFNPEGGSKNFRFATKDSHSVLSDHIQLVKGIRKPIDGFFLRAESFYNVANNIDKLDRESSMGRPIIESYGGISLHEQSHGESFMSLILNRFSGNGLYILDEPEAALSPTRQLAMVKRMHELIKEDSQFIIATHSPIILGYPSSVIYSADDYLKTIEYEETEHFQVMKEFVNNRKGILQHLLD